jgi:hypothetical protein
VVYIDRPAAGFAGPAFPLGSDECPYTVPPDRCEVFEHTHVVFLPVSIVQLFQTPAGEPAAAMVIPALYLSAGRYGAVSVARTIRRITPAAPVLLPLERLTYGAVHTAGCDERRPERVLTCHRRRWVFDQLIAGGLNGNPVSQLQCRPVGSFVPPDPQCVSDQHFHRPRSPRLYRSCSNFPYPP